jgi:hypothetical protein
MAFREGRAAAKENIRPFETAKTWRRYADEVDTMTREAKERDASRAIDGFLLNGLNATNLLLLTGAGVVSRSVWKLPWAASPFWATWRGQATRPRGIDVGGSPRFCQPSSLRMVIWPEASSDQNSMAAVSGEGSTVWCGGSVAN